MSNSFKLMHTRIGFRLVKLLVMEFGLILYHSAFLKSFIVFVPVIVQLFEQLFVIYTVLLLSRCIFSTARGSVSVNIFV